MAKLRYGQQGQVSFTDLEEFFYAMGFLANSRNAELRWENNEDQGAWGSEGRIYCLVPEEKFPQCFRFTAGTGNVFARVNCNDYVGTLVTEYNFNYNGKKQNIEKILEAVPEKYRDAFQAGYGVKINVNPAYKPPIRRGYATQRQATTQIKTEVKPVIKERPKPIPISVGTEVVHKAFGKGTVYEVENQYLRIRFQSVGEKSFVNPDAFEKGFLKL